jgi:F-type H+-transporting ATPase subunit b
MLAVTDVNPVSFDVPNMFWGAVFFFALLILMYTVCLPPVRKAMRQRDEQRQLDEEAAERAGYDAEQVRRDYDVTLADARAEAARIVDRAREEAEAERSRKVAEVDAELAVARQGLMAELETARTAALEGLKGDVAQLATAAASRVVEKPLDASANQAIVDEFVASATRH